MYRVDWSKQAKKDYEIAVRVGLIAKIAAILAVLERNPFEPTSGHYFEKLVGSLYVVYSRRINYHNRVVYTVLPNDGGVRDENGNLYEGIVRIHEAWGHKYRKPIK